MACAQKPDTIFRQNRQVHLNRWGHQFSRLLAAEVCTSAVVMLDTPCSEVVWRVLATHSTREFPLHFPSRASPCVIRFQLSSTSKIYNEARVSIWNFLNICLQDSSLCTPVSNRITFFCSWNIFKDFLSPPHNIIPFFKLDWKLIILLYPLVYKFLTH